MASAAKRRRDPASSGSVPWSPMMFMNPGGITPGFSYGVLRRTYLGRPVELGPSEFVRRKLYPVDAPSAGDWTRPFTCSRWDVLLPPSGSDEHLSTQLLMASYERHLKLISWRQGLLCHLKACQPLSEPLHSSYERIRLAAREAFPLRRNLPAILVAHAPFLAGVDAGTRQPHVHICVPASALSLLGWGAPNDEITSDAGHLALYAEFKAAGAIA